MSVHSEELRELFARAWGASLAELCAEHEPRTLAELTAAQRERAREQARAPAASALLQSELERWLHARNQFLILDAAAHAELARALDRALMGIAHDDFTALAEHRRELTAFVRARLGPSPRDVVASEYSPALQLRVLGCDDARLVRAPVLDVGCGEQAELVRFLRARGVDAQGLDRAAPSDVATVGDWLAFDYGSARWGTVLSHLGFSLHFLHHHLAARDAAYDYARAYMAILRSLAPLGRFAYTPGLPFLEPLLDASMYRVHHVAFADELRVAALRDIEARTGLALSHATHVERL